MSNNNDEDNFYFHLLSGILQSGYKNPYLRPKLEHAEADLATLYVEGIVSEYEVVACENNMEKAMEKSINPNASLVVTIVGHDNLPAIKHELMMPRLKRITNEPKLGWSTLSLTVANRSEKMFAFLLPLMARLPRDESLEYYEHIWDIFRFLLEFIISPHFKKMKETYLPNKEEPELSSRKMRKWIVIQVLEFVDLTCGDQAYRFRKRVFYYSALNPRADGTLLEVRLDLGAAESLLEVVLDLGLRPGILEPNNKIQVKALVDISRSYNKAGFAHPQLALPLSVLMKRAGNLIPNVLLPNIKSQVNEMVMRLEETEEEQRRIPDGQKKQLENYTRLLRSIKKCMEERSQPSLKSLSAIRVWTTIDRAKLIQDLPMSQRVGKPRRERERQCVESLDIPKCLKEYLMDSLREHQIVN